MIIYFIAGDLFFKKIVKRLANVVFRSTGRVPAGGQGNSVAGFKIVAEIGPVLLSDIFRLSLRALVISAGIEEATVLAAMHIGLAIGAFFSARDFGNKLDFSSAVMTDHFVSEFRFIKAGGVEVSPPAGITPHAKSVERWIG